MANVEDPRQAVLSASWVSASLILIKGTSIIPIFGWETEGKEKNHSARMNQHLKPGTPGPEATLSLMLVFTHTHTHTKPGTPGPEPTLSLMLVFTHTHTHTHTHPSLSCDLVMVNLQLLTFPGWERGQKFLKHLETASYPEASLII